MNKESELIKLFEKERKRLSEMSEEERRERKGEIVKTLMAFDRLNRYLELKSQAILLNKKK